MWATTFVVALFVVENVRKIWYNHGMNESKIVLVKLYCGDYIIGEVSKDCAMQGHLSLDNPRIFGIVPTSTGSIGIVFQSVCPFSKKCKKHMDILNQEIMCRVEEDELEKEILNGYKSEVTGIKIASAAESIAINGESKTNPGEFVL
jgi:hypothetical protein